MKKTILALGLSLALVLCACAPATPANPVVANPTGDPSKIDLGVSSVKIGCVCALTGNSASMGLAQQQGIEIAIDEINAAGGIAGVPVELLMRDDEANPTKHLTNMEELVYKQDVNYVVGSCNSSCVAASTALLNENKIPSTVILATASALIDAEQYPYTFRTTMVNGTQAKWLAKYCQDNGYKRVVSIGDNTALGMDGMACFKESAAEIGLDVVDYISYTANDTDLTAVAQQIKNDQADIVISWSLGVDCAKIVKALDRLDYLENINYIGFSGIRIAGFMDLVGKIDCSNVMFMDMTSWTIPAEATKLSDREQEFYDKLVARYGAYTSDGSGRFSNPNDAARAYDAIYFYKWIVEQIGTVDGEAVKEAFETLSGEWDPMASGASYNYTKTDHEGYPEDECVICTVDQERLRNDHLFGDIPTRIGA